ncbi:MAG: ABC transporter permease [Mycetocola sp.]
MNPVRVANIAGLRRGAIEFRNSLQNPTDVGYYLVGSAIFVAVILLNRNNIIDELGISVAQLIFPGVLAMQVIFTATYGLASLIATEREDGTLLRAKSIPNGMTGYVAGQTTRTFLEFTFSSVIVVVAATILIDGLWARGPAAAAGAIAFLVLGLIAALSLGFAIGSIFKNPRSLGGWGFLVVGGLVAVSGLFAPIVLLPGWVQVIAQILPLYWIGLGLRSVILPESAVVAEIGDSWRTLETIAVLGIWAAIGLLLAPMLLRRMARRESGSAVDARRQSALQRF